MKTIYTAGIPGPRIGLGHEAIRAEVIRFAALLASQGIGSVEVWCSWNPELPDDSPLQSPSETLPPGSIVDFLDDAVKNGVWTYGDTFNRAGIDALDGSFTFLLDNDEGIKLGADNQSLLDAMRYAWDCAGYKVW